MPGDTWQKFANVRLFLGFMFGHPGKKLNFMTNDIGQYNEWNSDVSIDWGILENDLNRKLNLYMKDLNRLYKEYRAFYEVDFEYYGFRWIDFSDAANSILAFVRISSDARQILLFTFNMTPVIRKNYRFGVPHPGYYREILNSDSEIYGGSGVGNLGGINSQQGKCHEFEDYIDVTLPPLGVNIYLWEE
jgi:1,4-alpha-glucan branching enzyme